VASSWPTSRNVPAADVWHIGIWDLFGIWCLGFGISNMRAQCADPTELDSSEAAPQTDRLYVAGSTFLGRRRVFWLFQGGFFEAWEGKNNDWGGAERERALPVRNWQSWRSLFPPSPGYPLWGCSPAEPHSVSPGISQDNRPPGCLASKGPCKTAGSDPSSACGQHVV
jgi:hypothetical protein